VRADDFSATDSCCIECSGMSVHAWKLLEGRAKLFKSNLVEQLQYRRLWRRAPSRLSRKPRQYRDQTQLCSKPPTAQRIRDDFSLALPLRLVPCPLKVRFQISVSDDALALLHRKLADSRFPDEVNDAGWDYSMASLSPDVKRLVNKWKDGYDWRAH
jgi:hypothetical protein